MSEGPLATTVLSVRTNRVGRLGRRPGFSPGLEAVPSMVEDFKNQQFTRMWNEENKSKQQKFRNLMKSKLDLLHVEVTEENARAFYNGRLESRQPERIYQMPERSDDRRPPRRR